MSGFWQGVGAGVGSVGANFLSGYQSKAAQKRAFEYNMQLQHDAQAYQKEMWELANEYALPKNEIKRLMDAGVNPAMAFSNAGGAPQAVPTSPTSGGVSPNAASFSNSLGSAVSAFQDTKRVDNETAVADSVISRNEAEANKLNKEAEESSSRADLNKVDYEIRSDPEYIAAQTENPSIRNEIMRLDRDMSDLNYQFSLGTYGMRMSRESFKTLQSYFNVRNVARTYEKLGAEIRFLNAGTAREREQARVIRQDLDIRAGKAFLGRLQEDALRYCSEHGIKDSVSNEIVSFTHAMADEYASKVFENIYSSESSAVTANQESIYQKEHGQERREVETTEIERRGNWYRTNQWTQCINTGVGFVKAAVEVGGAVMTRGASTAVSGLITPKSGTQTMPLSPEARDVILKVFSESEKSMKIF